MVIDYLSKIRAELLEEKLSIESKKKSIHIEINENTKFIERLKEEENRNLWRDFLNFPYFTGFPAP